jgi:hypothetical protein
MVNSSLVLAQIVVAHDLVQDVLGKTVFLRYLTKELVGKAHEGDQFDEIKTLKREIVDMLQVVGKNLNAVSGDIDLFGEHL